MHACYTQKPFTDFNAFSHREWYHHLYILASNKSKPNMKEHECITASINYFNKRKNIKRWTSGHFFSSSLPFLSILFRATHSTDNFHYGSIYIYRPNRFNFYTFQCAYTVRLRIFCKFLSYTANLSNFLCEWQTSVGTLWKLHNYSWLTVFLVYIRNCFGSCFVCRNKINAKMPGNINWNSVYKNTLNTINTRFSYTVPITRNYFFVCLVYVVFFVNYTRPFDSP